MKKLLHFLGLATQAELHEANVRANHYLWERNDARAALDAVESRLWKKYQERQRNDLSMTLSWLYTQHVTKVSLGQPESPQAGTWPYYPQARLLTEEPKIEPEKIV